MNYLQTDVKMTSRDIAELTGKQHAHVMRDIRNEIDSLGETGQSIFGESTYINSQNKQQPCYEFGKKGAMQLALKYDAQTRYKVIEHIERLENAFNNPESIISRALILANEQLTQLKPYADFGKSITASDDGILIGEYAKILNNAGIEIGQNRLFAWLRDNGYLIKAGERKNQPMQKYVDMGIFLLKERAINKGSVEIIRFTTLITGKGQKYILEKMKEQLCK